MRKALTTVLVGALLLIPMQVQAKTPTLYTYDNYYTKAEKRTCSFERNDHYSRSETFDTYKCVYRKINPDDMGIAGYIAIRESKFNAYAKNTSSSASGVYQFVSGTWDSLWRTFRADGVVRTRHLVNDVFDARSNIFIAAYAMRRWGCSPWGMTC